jgi:DNA-binding transcriptional MerR regulator
MLMAINDVARYLGITLDRLIYAAQKGAVPMWKKWNGKRYYDQEQFNLIREYFADRQPWDDVVPNKEVSN